MDLINFITSHADILISAIAGLFGGVSFSVKFLAKPKVQKVARKILDDTADGKLTIGEALSSLELILQKPKKKRNKKRK